MYTFHENLQLQICTTPMSYGTGENYIGMPGKMSNACIQLRIQENDYSALPYQNLYWRYSLYVDTRWLLPDYVPTPLVKYVRLTHYVDANIFHGQITTSYATGIPHFLNKNPLGWYSKKQINLEKATYGSEFVSTHTCVDHIIYLSNTP